MKISPEEIVAASDAFLKNGYLSEALEAAYTVRKQRKAAKRERQRKEKDKQVVESVKPADGWEPIASFVYIDEATGKIIRQTPTPSKAPEWDGEFSIDEYQMRNGDKATVTTITGNTPYPLIGWIDGAPYHWHSRGFTAAEPHYDLIRPWPKGEQ